MSGYAETKITKSGRNYGMCFDHTEEIGRGQADETWQKVRASRDSYPKWRFNVVATGRNFRANKIRSRWFSRNNLFILLADSDSTIAAICFPMAGQVKDQVKDMHDIILFQHRTFTDCFRSYYRMLCSFAYEYLQETGKAEDVVQEVFIRLLEKPVSFENEEHCKHFLYKATRNACLNLLERKAVRNDILEKIKDEQREQEAADLFGRIVRAEVYRKIIAAIDELPQECGRVFRLSYIEGLSNEEIAAMLNISIHTVKSQKNKAKCRLREKLKGLYPLLVLLLYANRLFP